jgi:integrase/recombinase XerD
MPKNNRNGQAAILSNEDYSKIRKNLKNLKHKLIWDVAKFTGERWGAILKLQVSDVWDDKGRVRSEITFRACTRKASTDGTRKTRQVPVNPTLREILSAYKPPGSGLLFGWNGKSISLQRADFVLRRAIARAGLDGKGISTHSTRRTFITRLHQAGIDIYTIQEITGHQDLKALGKYIDISADKIKNAIAVL